MLTDMLHVNDFSKQFNEILQVDFKWISARSE